MVDLIIAIAVGVALAPFIVALVVLMGVWLATLPFRALLGLITWHERRRHSRDVADKMRALERALGRPSEPTTTRHRAWMAAFWLLMVAGALAYATMALRGTP